MFFEEDFFEPQRAQRAQRERKKKERSLQLMRGLVTLRGLPGLIWAAIYL
jgi:hypothetical protein